MSNEAYLRFALDQITYDNVKPLSCTEFDKVMDILNYWKSDYGEGTRFVDGIYMGLLCRQAGRVSNHHKEIIGDKKDQNFRAGYIRGLRNDYDLLMDAIRGVLNTYKPREVKGAKD